MWPQLCQRQFAGVITSGALSRIQAYDHNNTAPEDNTDVGAHLALINANSDDESGQVKVLAEVMFSKAMTKVGISYNVSMLAELPMY